MYFRCIKYSLVSFLKIIYSCGLFGVDVFFFVCDFVCLFFLCVFSGDGSSSYSEMQLFTMSS